MFLNQKFSELREEPLAIRLSGTGITVEAILEAASDEAMEMTYPRLECVVDIIVDDERIANVQEEVLSDALEEMYDAHYDIDMNSAKASLNKQ